MLFIYITYVLDISSPFNLCLAGHGLRRRSLAARLLRLLVRIPPVSWISISCECCALSGVSATGRSLVQRSPTECGA